MITRFATIVFFLAFGIGFFVGGLQIVAAIAALVAGIAMLANV